MSRRNTLEVFLLIYFFIHSLQHDTAQCLGIRSNHHGTEYLEEEQVLDLSVFVYGHI